MKTYKLHTLILFIIIAISNLCTSAQTIVQMEYDGGVYKIPCRVNGAKLNFILDTGAHAVCISADMAEVLLEYGYISKDDFIGIGSSTIADGSVVEHLELMINDIEIGGLHLKNVKAVVIASQSASLLMGQSALQKLGSYTINGNKLVINNYTAGDGAKREQLLKNAKASMDKSLYASAISYYLEAEKILELNYVDMERLAWCYKYEKNYKDCYYLCKKWLSLYENLNHQNFNGSLYELFWRCNYYYGYNEEALLYKQKRMLVRDVNTDKSNQAWDQENLGQIYLALKRYDDAIACFEKAINIEAEDKGKKPKNLVIKDSDLLGAVYWYLCDCYRHKYDKKNYKKYLELSEKCGYEKAIKINSSKESRETFYMDVFKMH